MKMSFRAAHTGGVVLVATVTGLIAAVLFLALSYASLGTTPDALRTQIRAGFDSGQLRSEASWLHGDTDIGAHQFNDCLILYQALDDRAPRAQRSISPLTTPTDTDSSCARLRTLITTGVTTPPRFYHQYLHAHTTLARLLVPALGIRGTRELYRLVLSVTLLAGIGYAALGLARGKRSALQAVWLIVFLAFARLFGLEAFGQSLGHAPSDLVPIGFLVFLCRASAEAPITARSAIVAASILGALTMEFEFLTGGLPLGLAIVLGITPVAIAPGVMPGLTTVRAGLAYVVAATMCVVAKLALVSAVFGTAPLVEAGRQLLFRTGLSHEVNRDKPAGWNTFFTHFWAGIDALAPGMQWLTIGLIVLAVTVGSWGYRQLRSSIQPTDRTIGVALLGSNLVILLWMVIFWQHTAEHAWFMDRLLVWPVATGGALFVLALVQRAASLRDLDRLGHAANMFAPHDVETAGDDDRCAE